MAKKTENEVKETKKEAAVMDEAAKEKFQQKLKDLLALAKKKKNMLEYQEISDFFADMQLEAEQFDKIRAGKKYGSRCCGEGKDRNLKEQRRECNRGRTCRDQRRDQEFAERS